MSDISPFYIPVVCPGKKTYSPTQEISRAQRKVKFGVLKNKIKIPKDFDAPLPDEILNEFERS